MPDSASDACAASVNDGVCAGFSQSVCVAPSYDWYWPPATTAGDATATLGALLSTVSVRTLEEPVLPTRSVATAATRYAWPSASDVVSRVPPNEESDASVSVPTSVPNVPVSVGSQPGWSVPSQR